MPWLGVHAGSASGVGSCGAVAAMGSPARSTSIAAPARCSGGVVVLIGDRDRVKSLSRCRDTRPSPCRDRSYFALSTSHSATAPVAPVAAAPPASPAANTSTTAGGATNSEPVVLADGRHPVLLKSIDSGPGDGYLRPDPGLPGRGGHQRGRQGPPGVPTAQRLLICATSTPDCARRRCGLTRPSPPTSWPAATRTPR